MYWDSSPSQQPKLYGIAGYTPITIKVPKGAVKIVLELSGFKPFEQVLDVRKNTTITPTLERAPRMAKLDLQSNSDSAGAEVVIDGVPRGTIPNSFELTAGRHQIEVKKAGHKPFSDWVDLQEGERRTRGRHARAGGGADRDAAGQLGRGRRGLRRRAAQGRGARRSSAACPRAITSSR